MKRIKSKLTHESLLLSSHHCHFKELPFIVTLRNYLNSSSYIYPGLPAGVINFVFGLGPKAGEAIVKHPRVPIVSFTGGTVTAVKLRQAAAPFSKKLSLEVFEF